MFCTGQNKLKLLSRNEGKLKAYESCVDVRAWSHDKQARDRYIRDWIKSDMPICIIPVCTVSSYLRTMTLRNRGRSTPRCQPNCKSKVLLESICTSCHAMKECLKNEKGFDKYFEEEEFETSHWPCERCLEALKSIKMFWRIISEKIFNIHIPKDDEMESATSESVQSVAKAWQEELVQQALVVKKLTPILNEQLKSKPSYGWKSYTKYLKNIMNFDNVRFLVEDDNDYSIVDENINEKNNNCKDKATETSPEINITSINNRSSRALRKKISKCTSVRVKTVDFGSSTCNIDKEEKNAYKNNLDYLQQRYNIQSDELSQLKRENISLKLQLDNMSKNYVPTFFSDVSASQIPKPYELCNGKDKIKDIDSEMIITLKNCENENYKHVSLLQVLHKTNGSIINGNLDEKCCEKNDDPMEILTKVHNRFGAIVKRELTIANNQKKYDPKKVKIESYQRIHTSSSVPSCSTVSSHSTLSDFAFASTTEV